MSAPLTKTQISTDSILDINGKQTYLGNSFMLPTAGTSLANTSETVLGAITNPTGSGKSIFLFSRMVSTNNNSVLVRYYLNPILNVPGSITVPLNVRTGATTASVSICYLAPSITSNGSLLETIPASVYGIKSGVLIIIDPGTSILLTGQQALAGTTLCVAENAWYEI